MTRYELCEICRDKHHFYLDLCDPCKKMDDEYISGKGYERDEDSRLVKKHDIIS